MRLLAIAALLVGCGSSWSGPGDGGPEADASSAPDATASDAGPIRDGGADLAVGPDASDRDASAADAFAPSDAGPPTCADYPELVHTGDLVITDAVSLAEASAVTTVEGTLEVRVTGEVVLRRLRSVGTLELGTRDGPLEVAMPCLRDVTSLTTRNECTLSSPPIEVETASLSGTSNLPSLVSATEIGGGGNLNLPGLVRVTDGNLHPRSIALPALQAADYLFIQAPPEGAERFADVPVDLPSLVSVTRLIVETNGAVNAPALERAESIGVLAAAGDFSGLQSVTLAFRFHRRPGFSGTLDLASLVSIEDLYVSAHAPSTLRAPRLAEAEWIELGNIRPEMHALERVQHLFIQGGAGFELPILRYVVEVHVWDLVSTQPLTLPVEGYTSDHIPHVTVSDSQAPSLYLLGTSLLELSVSSSAIPLISIPNAATINFLTLANSEVEELELSSPPTAYWLWLSNVVGITQCECEALAPYIIDDGHVSTGGDLRCEGLAPCE